MRDDVEEVQSVFMEAALRMRAGRLQYGEFNPERDTRDLFIQAEEELLDTINYLAMQILKIRATRKRLLKATS